MKGHRIMNAHRNNGRAKIRQGTSPARCLRPAARFRLRALGDVIQCKLRRAAEHILEEEDGHVAVDQWHDARPLATGDRDAIRGSGRHAGRADGVPVAHRRRAPEAPAVHEQAAAEPQGQVTGKAEGRPVPLVELPGGGILELVAIGEHPSKDTQWWAPDGSLTAPPYQNFEGECISENLKREMAVH